MIQKSIPGTAGHRLAMKNRSRIYLVVFVELFSGHSGPRRLDPPQLTPPRHAAIWQQPDPDSANVRPRTRLPGKPQDDTTAFLTRERLPHVLLFSTFAIDVSHVSAQPGSMRSFQVFGHCSALSPPSVEIQGPGFPVVFPACIRSSER